jgi:DNA polymerase-1
VLKPVFPAIPILLVDGDIVAYRCAAAAEKTKYLVTVNGDSWVHEPFDSAKEAKAYTEEWRASGVFGVDIWSRKELQPEENALNNAKTLMQAISDKWKDSIVQVYLSGEKNFRDNVWTVKKYKGNRDQPKPTHLSAVRDYLLGTWFATVSHNQEADDDIGIATSDGTVVVSTDKDLDQIPGWHYNWVRDEVYYVNPEDSEQFKWEQVISGDMTDNIPGLPGYGPVRAREYLDGVAQAQGGKIHDYTDAVYALFQKNGYDYAYFHEMVTLITILREKR